MAAAGLKGLFQQYLFRVGLKGKGLREWVRMVHGIRTRLWAKHLLDHGDELGQFLPSFLSEEERLRVGLRLQILVSKLVFSSGTSSVKFFHLAEGVGVHVLPLHFYSPVPQPSDLGNETFAFSWEGSPYLRLAPSEQLAVIRRISPLATELDLLVAAGKTAFQWYNRKFDSLDAALYYGLIRLFKPSKIVEVGSGYSTLVAQAALEANEVGSLTSVDPHPPEFLTAQQHPRIQLIPQ
ncbi:MAG: hypothetical protein RMI39_01380 [Thermoanaerobaculum sp.]|nr:hypothetical protein [Thermoanaerobaculum sp.]